jgi:hypothetical protein
LKEVKGKRRKPSPHPTLSKGEGLKKSEVKVLSFGEDE